MTSILNESYRVACIRCRDESQVLPTLADMKAILRRWAVSESDLDRLKSDCAALGLKLADSDGPDNGGVRKSVRTKLDD